MEVGDIYNEEEEKEAEEEENLTLDKAILLFLSVLKTVLQKILNDFLNCNVVY